MAEAADCPLSDDDVVAFVAGYTERSGFGSVSDVGPDTPLTDLGLDSIPIVVMLVQAREELAATRRVPACPAPRDIPPRARIADGAPLLRSLCADCGGADT